MQQLDQSVADAIRILAHSFRDVSLKSAIDQACPTPLSRNQFLILNLLNSNGPLAVGRIAQVLEISSAAVSKIVDKLAEKDLVCRRLQPADRRVHEIELLPAGFVIVERFISIVSRRHEAFMDHFTETEKASLVDLLQRFTLLVLADEEHTDAICLQCWSKPGTDCILKDLPGGCLRRREH